MTLEGMLGEEIWGPDVVSGNQNEYWDVRVRLVIFLMAGL